jgi:hypothetical protein
MKRKHRMSSLKRSRVSSDGGEMTMSTRQTQIQKEQQHTAKRLKKTFFAELNSRWDTRMKNIRADFVHNRDEIRTSYNMKFFKDTAFRFDWENMSELKNASCRLHIFDTMCKKLDPSETMLPERLSLIASLSFLAHLSHDVGDVRTYEDLLELREKDLAARREKIKEIIDSQEHMLFCAYTFFLPVMDDEVLDLLSRQTTWTHQEWEVAISSIYFQPDIKQFQEKCIGYQPFIPLWINDKFLKREIFEVWERLVAHAHKPRYLSLPDDRDLYELVCLRLFEGARQTNPDLHLEIYPEFINTLAAFFFKVFTYLDIKSQKRYIPTIVHQYIRCRSFVEPFVKRKIFSIGKGLFLQSGSTSLDGWIKMKRQNVKFFIQQRGWIGSISQSLFDVVSKDIPLTLADVLGYLLEHKPSSSHLQTPVVSTAVRSFLSTRTPLSLTLSRQKQRQHVLKHATRYYRKKDDHFFLYHGTGAASAIEIIKNPQLIGKGLLGKGLYTTARYDEAIGYAYNRVKRQTASNDPVLLEFTLSFKDASELVFGEDFLINMRSSWRTQQLARVIGFGDKDIIAMKEYFLVTMIEKMIPALYTHRSQSQYLQQHSTDDADQDSRLNRQRREVIRHIVGVLTDQKTQIQDRHKSINVDQFLKKHFSKLYKAVYNQSASQSRQSQDDQFHRLFHSAIEYVYTLYKYFQDIVFRRNDQKQLLLRGKDDIKISLELHMRDYPIVYGFFQKLFRVRTIDEILDILYDTIVVQPRGHGQYIIIKSENMLARCQLSQVFRLYPQ